MRAGEIHLVVFFGRFGARWRVSGNCMSEPGILLVVGAVTGLLAAIGGVVAAVAACRSASIAKQASDRADHVNMRGLRRDAHSSAQRVITSSTATIDLGNDLSRTYETLAAFTGSTGGSRLKLEKESIAERCRNLTDLQEKARQWLEGRGQETEVPEHELSAAVAQFGGYEGQIERIREKFQRDFATLQGQIDVYRKGSPP